MLPNRLYRNVSENLRGRRLRDLGENDPEIWQVLAAIPMEVVRRQFLGADIP